MENFQLLQFPDLKLYARRFEAGARKAAEDGGITVIIDVFRASNTIIELIKLGAKVIPVASVDEALLPKFDPFVRLGEDSGETLSNFDFDNSPMFVHEHPHHFAEKKVVIRTTNGTRGIIASFGSQEILVGTFQNFTSIAQYCVAKLRQGVSVSFVAMGSNDVEKIEDDYCANMFVIKSLELLGETMRISSINEVDNNPWRRDWRVEIMQDRGDSPKKLDYEFSLRLDITSMIPIFNTSTGYIEVI